MKTITCSRCSSAFDVSQMEPGLLFVCGNCGANLQVPFEMPQAATPVTPARPPSPRRAPPASPTPSTGAHTSRRPRTRSAPPPRGKKGPPIGLILGGIGGVLAIVIVVVIFATGSGGPDEPGPDVVDNPPAEVSKAEEIRQLRRKINGASDDVLRLEELCREAQRLGAPDLAKLAAQWSLKQRDDLDWAYVALGRVRFDASGMPDEDAVIYITPDWERLQELKKLAWLTPEQAEEVAAAKKRFADHMRKLKTDGHYRRVCQTKSTVRLHPVFKDYKSKLKEKTPYLIFLESTDDATKAEKVRKLAERKARIFTCLYDTFMEKFGKSLGLPRLESKTFEDDVILRCWIFANRESFAIYNRIVGIGSSAGIGAYYNPADQWMIIPTGAAGGIGKVRGQDMDTNVSFHEGTHQLVHHFTKKILEAETGESMTWTDKRLICDAMWFREGLAEWFGSALPKGDTWEPFQINYYRIGGWKRIRAQKMDEWSFPELLAARGNGDLRVPNKPHMGAQFYGQAWAFVHFLWNFEDGKYRPMFLEYFRNELHGKSGLPHFKRIFKVENPEGSTMEKEFEAYCDKLLDDA